MAHIDLTDAERDVLAALCEAAVESNFDSGDMMRLLFKACELRDYEAIRAALAKANAVLGEIRGFAVEVCGERIQ